MLLIVGILAFYCLVASPGVAAFFYVIDTPRFSPRMATRLAVLLAVLFAPVLVGSGHIPALVPFVASPWFDDYHDGYWWPNGVVAAICGFIMYVVRRRKERGWSPKRGSRLPPS